MENTFFYQEAECWRSAVDLSGTLLLETKQGTDGANQYTIHTPQTLQVCTYQVNPNTKHTTGKYTSMNYIAAIAQLVRASGLI